jgi:hypothetical protein
MAQNEKVIISVELRDKGVTTGSKKAKDSIDKVTDSTKRLAKATKDLKFQQSDEAKKLAELQIKAQLAAKANRELAISTMNASKATKEGKTQTGLNNAILVEAGRAASDFQYGMQGMANNIGQLTTLMGQHIQTQGGFVASMGELLKSIWGIQGILIGVQLFISFLPQLEKKFKSSSKAAKELNEEINKLQQEVFAAKAVSENYVKVIEDVNTSEKDRKAAIEELIRLTPTLKEEDFKYGNNLDKVREKIKLYSIAQANRIEIDKLVQANSAQLAKFNKIQSIKEIKDEKERIEQMKAFLDEEVDGFEERRQEQLSGYGVAFIKNSSTALKTNKEVMEDYRRASKKITSETESILNRINSLTGGLISGTEGEGDSTTKVFKAKLLSFLNEIKQAREIVNSAEVQNEEETLKTKQDLRRKELEQEFDLFKVKEDRRFANFLKNKKLTEKERQDAKVTYDENIALATKEYNDTLAILTEADKAETQLLTRRQGERGLDLDNKRIIFDREIELLRNKIDRTKALVDETEDGSIKGLIVPKTREDLEEDAAILEERLALMDVQLAKEIEDEEIRMQLQKERTQLELQLSQKRLNIAQLEQQGKDRLLQDGISLINSASAFAKKGTAVQKALAISSTTVSTWAAAQEAYRSQLKTTPSTIAPIRAKVAYAAAVAKGLVSVKNIINEKKPDGSGGVGGAAQAVQAPDFNIIGSTGVNQLATAIGDTTQEPIKAYVVSSEITSAQELDRNIIDSASL